MEIQRRRGKDTERVVAGGPRADMGRSGMGLKDPKMPAPPSSESDKLVLFDSAPHREMHGPREGGRVGEDVLGRDPVQVRFPGGVGTCGQGLQRVPPEEEEEYRSLSSRGAQSAYGNTWPCLSDNEPGFVYLCQPVISWKVTKWQRELAESNAQHC